MSQSPLRVAEMNCASDRASINVFVVSPNSALRQQFEDKLRLPRWSVIQASSGAAALEMLREHDSNDAVLLLDPHLPDLEPNEFSSLLRARYPSTQVLMLNSQTGQLFPSSYSGNPASASLVEEINGSGMIQVTAQPFAEWQHPHPIRDKKAKLQSMIGESEVMQRVYNLTRMVAGRDTTVLVMGESGTGKDLVAQELHLMSPRSKQPFVVVNCAAIPEALLEAELFGYTKGSFTGAVQSRIGRIHAAHGGTLFLDEIGDMPLSLQSKILRFLEQGEVQRLGGNDNLKVDVRVIAATNVNLKKKVEEREFREDLYYRLAVYPIQLPPLRDRMGDLEELATAFVARFRPGLALTRDALQVLAQHRWPGNVRELRNAMERATILAGEDYEIRSQHILL